MDPVTLEKFQAKKRYNKKKYRQNLLPYLLTALVLSVCISKALSFPSSLFSSMKLFFSIALPDVGAFFASPKCLFIVGNAIVIFLVGESKFGGPSSPNSDIYDDYVQQQRSLRRQPSVYVKEKEKNFVVRMGKRADEIIQQIREGEGERVQGEKEEERKERGGEKEDDGEEEENGMKVDELKRRVEDFIARVNRQRRLEAQMPD